MALKSGIARGGRQPGSTSGATVVSFSRFKSTLTPVVIIQTPCVNTHKHHQPPTEALFTLFHSLQVVFQTPPETPQESTSKRRDSKLNSEELKQDAENFFFLFSSGMTAHIFPLLPPRWQSSSPSFLHKPHFQPPSIRKI